MACATASVCEWSLYCVPEGACLVEWPARMKARAAQLVTTAQRAEADLVARWRLHHPEATCADRVAVLLAEMEGSVRR